MVAGMVAPPPGGRGARPSSSGPPSLGSAWGPQALPGAPSASLRAFLTGKKPFRRAKGEARARGATFLSGTLGRQKSGHAPLSGRKGLILKTPGPAGCRRRSGGGGGAGKGRGARWQRRREMAAEHKVRAIAWPPGGRGGARATPPPPRFPPYLPAGNPKAMASGAISRKPSPRNNSQAIMYLPSQRGLKFKHSNYFLQY